MNWLTPAWLLAAALLLAMAGMRRWRAPADDWHRVISSAVLRWLRPGPATARWPLVLVAGALTCVALAGPATEKIQQSVLRHAQGWIVLVDVSRSMGLTDIAPSRAAAAREAARQLIQRSGSRPVALILFAGDAYLAGPVSFDKQHLAAFLNGIEPGVIPIEGSRLRRALTLADSISRQGGMLGNRLFVLSDATGDIAPALPAAASIARNGHRVDVLTFAGAQQSAAGRADLTGASQLADAGNGLSVTGNALGQIDWAALQLDESSWHSRLLATPLQTLTLQNQSHWILLLLLPLLLGMFAKRSS